MTGSQLNLQTFLNARVALLVGVSALLVSSHQAGAAIPGPFGAKSNLLQVTPEQTAPQKPQMIPQPAPPQQIAPSAPTSAPRDESSLPSRTNSQSSIDTAVTIGSPTKFTCADVRRAALRMTAHASNLVNKDTTRTPTGGPYLRLDVNCRLSGSFCEIQQKESVKTEFAPGHPDADSSGYLKRPMINAGSEWAGLNSSANELKMLASQGVCETKTIEQGTSIILKYHADFGIASDTMTFTRDGRLVSWSRTGKDGVAQNFAFGENGMPLGL